MKMTSPNFKQNARDALADEQLQRVLGKFGQGFPRARALARERLPEFDDLRDHARDIKNHVLDNLDFYLEQFEAQVIKHGGQVHWCRDDKEARETILSICQSVGAKTVTKSKSMIGEEIGINEHLSENGVEPIETDLGEYIIQLRDEPPSHIIAPAIHLSKEQVAETFRETHTERPADRDLSEPRVMLDEAREELREKFLNADVGLTGANMLVAETGSIAIVTNEGNADLTAGIPNVHIAVASIEKIVPTLEDASTILRVLARSATGQDFSVYTTFFTGPKRAEDTDGPAAFHMVLLDNGRTTMLGNEFHDILRCIRCGSCINHCPVYGSVGGHAYGWVYPGPMGSVLTPGLTNMAASQDLPNASTFCGRCEAVCPMRIPLPQLLRSWREKQFREGLTSQTTRFGLGLWTQLASRPCLYRIVTGISQGFLRLMAGRKARLSSVPLAGGWTAKRDLAVPMGGTFMAQWKKKQKS